LIAWPATVVPAVAHPGPADGDTHFEAMMMRSLAQESNIRSIAQISSEQRTILFINQVNGSSLPVQRLRALGWHVIQFNHVENSLKVVENCQVGLVQFERFDAEFVFGLQKLFQLQPDMRWVALVGKGELEDKRLTTLIRNNFYDFHTLPLDINRLNIVLGHAHGLARLAEAQDQPETGAVDEDGMVGISPPVAQLRKHIRKAAVTDTPILISGESGTGKELVARSIHRHSAQGKGPFVAVNCASLPATLIQAELFGHEKGAFTGAHARKIGLIEAAANGTLFLDEIGDLSIELQTNLLRFLQERTITRVGGHDEIPVNARVIAATNVDLERAIEAGTFRKDLYYRLNVIQVRTVPLRERREDIECLAMHFLEKFRHQGKRRLKGFSAEALKALGQHGWPGNIRELSNKILRAVVVAEGKIITAEDLDLNTSQDHGNVASLEEARNLAEARAIQSMMVYTRKNMSETARLLGITRATLYRLISKHNLMLAREREEADALPSR
jgi:DNA-binding NtrC family response regulator